MTVEDFQSTAQTNLNVDNLIYVVVGDKETQWEAVNAFANGKVIELDIYGNPI